MPTIQQWGPGIWGASETSATSEALTSLRADCRKAGLFICPFGHIQQPSCADAVATSTRFCDGVCSLGFGLGIVCRGSSMARQSTALMRTLGLAARDHADSRQTSSCMTKVQPSLRGTSTLSSLIGLCLFGWAGVTWQNTPACFLAASLDLHLGIPMELPGSLLSLVMIKLLWP